MSQPLQSKIALITGASGGIGRAAAQKLALLGADIAVHYATNRAAADEVVAAVQQLGRNAVAMQADLGDPISVQSLVDETARRLGRIDILIANAGRAERKHLDELTLEEWQQTMAINLTAPFLLAQKVLPGMREQGWGRVVFTGSVAAYVGGIVGPHYAASKAGLLGLTHWIASNYAKNGVTANCVVPALIEATTMLPTDTGNFAQRSFLLLSSLVYSLTGIPVGRLGQPDEVADAIVLFVTNGYITNQTLSVDGGMHPH
ncbi:hypothetical protein BC937DRAFT_87001 [Endogone sp. FLAS-F59071]|nr:hypothetical protein BC937DRAFT_87001 [Endogone sp. FLAS-F59071]|eukprot:RUS19750.1 hypothetical protein BC937DRAFT_87001 [Endogone sp. FLAS-F59071]